MRPISLSDEALDHLDREDQNEFDNSLTDHGRRKSVMKRHKETLLGMFDQDEDEDQEILDLVDQMDAGVVDYD